MVLEERILNLKRAVNTLQAKCSFEEQNVNRLKEKIGTLEKEKINLLKIQNTLDKAIEIVSANGIGKIESIVSGGLRLVFEKDLKFVVEKKEGTRGISYRLNVKKGEVVGDPLSTFGGGIVNVVSFLLRVILIKRFKLAKFLVIDESFNNVSPNYLPKVSSMMTTLCNDHGYTILAITHQPSLAAAAKLQYCASLEEGVPTLKLVESNAGEAK